MAYQFNYITASGTFDHLHKGHKYFLKEAFELSKNVLVGITSDQFIKNKPHFELIEPFAKRKEAVVNFLKSEHLLKRAKIFQLNDVVGPATDKNNPVQAILVTKKTKKGAQLVNQKRQKSGLVPLKIITINFLKTSQNDPISSRAIRQRLLAQTLFLPQNLRPFLKKPFGKLILGSEDDLSLALEKAKKLVTNFKPKLLICVGDVVTRLFNEAKIVPDLAIVDFRIRRQKVIKNLKQLGFTKDNADYTVANKPGRVSFKLAHAVEQVLREPTKKQVILVLGEEDLAVLPSLVFAPFWTLILYGQPGQGIVAVEVNKKTRQRALRLANKFENERSSCYS